MARSLRRAGRIPGVLYGEGKSVLLDLDPKDVTKILHSGAGENALITLKIDGLEAKASTAETVPGERLTILRDFQLDPVTGKILHADLFEISLSRTIRVRVHVEVIGTVPEGVKEGGVLQHQMREVEIECLPMAIPERLEVDASGLMIGEAIHIRDLQLGEGVKIHEHPEQVVVSVAAPISDAKLEEMLTATAKEAKEPELIAKEEAEADLEGKPEAKAAGEPAGAKSKKEEAKDEKKEGKPKG